MANKYINKPGPVKDFRDGVPEVTQKPLPGSDIPIVRDYPIATETILPDPKAIKAVVTKRQGNQINLTAARAGDPEPYIFGRCLCEPTLIAADDSGELLYMDLLWAGHECEEIEFCTFSNINEGLFDFLGNAQHFTGATGQVASSIMAGLKGSYDTLAGKTHSVIFWQQAFGLDIKAMIKGAKLRDPRNSPDTPVYSANAALCLARIMEDSGYTCDDAALILAANYCDEMIGSPQETRWEVGLQIRDIQDLRYWVQAFAVYSNCFVDIQGGTVYIIPDTPRASNHTVTANDMLAGSVQLITPGARMVPEHVAINYLPIVTSGPLYEQLVYVDPRTATTATTATPGSITSLSLPGIQSYSRARRLALMTYNKAHNSLPLEFMSFDEGLNRTVGDVGTITNAQYGLSSDTYALINNTAVEIGRWKRKYDVYAAGNYSSALFSESAVNATTLQDPNDPPVGPTPTLTQETYTDAYGVIQSRIKITWTGVTWPYIIEYHVVATGDDGGATVVLDTYVDHTGAGDTHSVYTGPTAPGVTYTVDIGRKSNTQAQGDAGSADITITAPDILWSETPLSVYNADDGTDSILSPNALARILFFSSAYEFPDKTAATYTINVATFGSEPLISHDFLAGEYLIKFVVVPTASPAPAPPTIYFTNADMTDATNQAGEWNELYRFAGTEIRIYDTIDDAVDNAVVLDITIAKNDGASPYGPLAGTEKTKRCTFFADYGDEPYIVENFAQADGTDIDTTTFFATMFGDPEVQSGVVVGGSTASPAHASGDHAATTNDTWSVFADAMCQVRVNFGIAAGTFGILGRQADAPNAGNCFQLVITDADTANPVLKLQEMSGTAAAMTLVATRATIILTGEGPFNVDAADPYFAATMELEAVGTLITGRIWTPVIGIPYTVTYTTTTYQTQTRWGFRLSGVNDGWIDDFKVYPLEPYPVLAKEFGAGSSPISNYYRTGHAPGASPTIWTGGLIPATSSGDSWNQITLVFCVYVVAHTADGFIFGSDQARISVKTSDSNGGLTVSAMDVGTGIQQNITISGSGSPSDFGGLTPGAWHSIMISAPSGVATAKIWIDGAQVYSGNWNTSGNTFAPMDWSGRCYVGAGDYVVGSPDFYAGLHCYLSYVWCKEQYLDPATYWTQFFDENNKPKWIGSIGQNVTGSTPATYCPNGDFTNNLGTGPDWTEIGTVPNAPSSPSD